MAKKGKLIVLDGTDGSGKATQVKLLQAELIKEGYKVKESSVYTHFYLIQKTVRATLRGNNG